DVLEFGKCHDFNYAKSPVCRASTAGHAIVRCPDGVRAMSLLPGEPTRPDRHRHRGARSAAEIALIDVCREIRPARVWPGPVGRFQSRRWFHTWPADAALPPLTRVAHTARHKPIWCGRALPAHAIDAVVPDQNARHAR